MSDCCSTPKKANTCSADGKTQAPASRPECPACGAKGRAVETLTLKCLLTPDALRHLRPELAYRFCASSDCELVYFAEGLRFRKNDILVPVFQKDEGDHTPVCYCFDYTRKSMAEEIRKTGRSEAVADISKLVKAGLCACEFRNPQGSCCLGNIALALRELKEK